MGHSEDFVSNLEDKARPAMEGLADAAKAVEDALDAGVKNTTTLIKKYPLESALVSFGVGLVAGLLLRKRD